MISAWLYEYIYLLLVAILTFAQCFQYNRYSWTRVLNPAPQRNIVPLLLVVFLSLFIGFRPISQLFVDTIGYDEYYQFIFGEVFSFDWDTTDLVFINLMHYCASLRLDVSIFFLIISTIYFCGMYIACRKMFPRDSMFALLILLAAFSTFSYGVNGIRSGAAASIFLVALAYRDKKWLSYLLMALAYTFHHSMQALIVAYIIVSLVKQPKYYLWLWAFCFVMALLHVSFFQHLFAGFTDEQGAGYLMFDATEESVYITGFRLDFIMYSAMPILVGYYLIFKRKLQSERFNFIYNLYVLANSVWLLCIYASYTNRIAYLSWQLLPIVLIYPFFNEKLYPQQYKQANYIALAHLAFTLFMAFVYY